MTGCVMSVRAVRCATVDSDGPAMASIRIELPAAMLRVLRERAERRGITVVELIRRSVVLENDLYEAGHGA